MAAVASYPSAITFASDKVVSEPAGMRLAILRVPRAILTVFSLRSLQMLSVSLGET